VPALKSVPNVPSIDVMMAGVAMIRPSSRLSFSELTVT
jgi:hypothetical protein